MDKRKMDDGMDWLEAELADTLDEDYEIELSEIGLPVEVRRMLEKVRPETLPRTVYFRELLRLQSELIKLHDWVQYHRKKVVVLFEGRDSAGKGGVIKRITQRLNPRVVRVVALPAPN
nr:polyphosphate kinase 2 [Paracoccaceae bacterium]